MSRATYLVFGDLHGRILPAFRLAIAWARDYDARVAGLLQVGDLGYYPDLARLDKATAKHAADDPTELGAQDIVNPNPLAEGIFDDPLCPGGMWFTVGNHEDHDDLVARSGAAGRSPTFPVDAYLMVQCVRNGQVAELPGGLRVGALWGVDGDQLTSRKKLHPAGYVSDRAATQLCGEPHDVLLTHDAPLDAVRPGYGSERIAMTMMMAEPRFTFFGHYGGRQGEIAGDYGSGRLFHMAGMELKGRSGTAESGSVGVLRWDGESGEFDYVDDGWLRSFTRFNWKYR